MNRTALLLFTLAALAPFWELAAQQDRPVLRANSKTLTIIDGDHVKHDYWVLMPEKNPDVYYVEIPRKRHAVTFRSDIDELSFPVTFGDRVDFVILLNDKTACPTQVRAEHKKLQPYSRDRDGAMAEIPFAVGDNEKIYVRGRLNGGDELSFQFDLGCGGCIVKKASVPKANLEFDGTITLTNSDGVNEVPSSSQNQLQLGALHSRELPFAVADNMTHREDGLLGNTLFQDKVVEINYDRGVIVIHDSLPEIDSSYSKHAVILDGVVPFIRGSLDIGGERREGWFMVDTGSYTSKLYSQNASPWSKLTSEMCKLLWLGEAAEPQLAIGEHVLSGFNYSVHGETRDDDQLGLLGNDLLKRFNLILDNQNGFIYLQPNSLAAEPYGNPEYYLARGIVVTAILLAGSGVYFYRRRRRRLLAPATGH